MVTTSDGAQSELNQGTLAGNTASHSQVRVAEGAASHSTAAITQRTIQPPLSNSVSDGRRGGGSSPQGEQVNDSGAQPRVDAHTPSPLRGRGRGRVARVLHLVDDLEEQDGEDGCTGTGALEAIPSWVDRLLGDSGDEGDTATGSQGEGPTTPPPRREICDTSYTEADRDSAISFTVRVSTGWDPLLDPWVALANQDLQQGMLDHSWSEWLKGHLARPEVITLHR